MQNQRSYTAFDVYYLEGRVNYRLLFGAPNRIVRNSHSRSIVAFPQKRTVGYLRWRANEYGTQVWRCFVVNTVAPGDPATCLPGVTPGASILLSTRGKTYTKRFLGYFDTLQKRGNALEHVPDAYWRHLHLRLHLNMTPHELSDGQWSAGVVRRAIMK